MKNIKRILAKLEAADMHVHLINHSKDGYKGMNVPISLLVNSTHYVMKENKIVHIGNVSTINDFVLRL